MFYILVKENHCQESGMRFMKSEIMSDLGTDNVMDKDS
jgi:hypothetical protein